MPILRARLLHSPTPEWDEVRRFYRDTLGLTEIGGWDLPQDRGAFLASPSAELEIMELDAAAIGVFPSDGRKWSLLLEVDDLDAELARLAASGVTIDSEPVERLWGTRDVVVRDPSGTPIVLFEQLNQEQE